MVVVVVPLAGVVVAVQLGGVEADVEGAVVDAVVVVGACCNRLAVELSDAPQGQVVGEGHCDVVGVVEAAHVPVDGDASRSVLGVAADLDEVGMVHRGVADPSYNAVATEVVAALDHKVELHTVAVADDSKHVEEAAAHIRAGTVDDGGIVKLQWWVVVAEVVRRMTREVDSLQLVAVDREARQVPVAEVLDRQVELRIRQHRYQQALVDAVATVRIVGC